MKIADEAARVYYENTVFEVVSLELKSRTENEISFSVCVSKGGIAQEPDRTIFLEFVNGHWKLSMKATDMIAISCASIVKML